MARAIQELRGLHGDKTFKPFAVGECWDGSHRIEDWLDEANVWSETEFMRSIFPCYRLRDLCQPYGFSLRQLAPPGTVLTNRTSAVVTFVCCRALPQPWR